MRATRSTIMLPALGTGSFLAAIGAVPFAQKEPLAGDQTVFLMVLGLLIMPIAFGLITIGPRYLPAAEGSLVMLLEAALGPLWVWMALGETPNLRTVIGSLVVIGTLTLHSLVGLKSESPFRADLDLLP